MVHCQGRGVGPYGGVRPLPRALAGAGWAPLTARGGKGGEPATVGSETDVVGVERGGPRAPGRSTGADRDVLFALLSGQLTSDRAIGDGKAVITGGTRARRRMATL